MSLCCQFCWVFVSSVLMFLLTSYVQHLTVLRLRASARHMRRGRWRPYKRCHLPRSGTIEIWNITTTSFLLHSIKNIKSYLHNFFILLANILNCSFVSVFTTVFFIEAKTNNSLNNQIIRINYWILYAKNNYCLGIPLLWRSPHKQKVTAWSSGTTPKLKIKIKWKMPLSTR